MLIKSLNELMRLELDRYVRYHATDHPLFAQRYQSLRRARRKPSAPNLPVDSDISGVVTNKETGEVIAGALITLIEHTYSIETDTDGRYMLDELPPGTYTVSCHKPGFQVPEQASFILTNNDTVIHHFELQAVASAAA
ncbi:MAG: carboxypeptidase-like regulatory domain-containing protein [Bacteroidetes bacterium]|nr:carboxypeptidase-like regulatory domain-containing protein [Bacteroidota bacterium]